MKTISKFALTVMMTALSALPLFTQELSVKSLRLAENDLTARTEPRLDANKQPCALLKVQVRDQITEVQGNVVGTVINKGIEKWIYFTDGTKRFRLLFANYPTQDVTVTDYGVSSLRGNCTYELIIAGETLSVAGTQELRLQYSPPDATVLIDNMLQQGANGSLKLALSLGQHNIIIAKNGYLSYSASTEIVRDRPTALSISLMKDDKVPERVTPQSVSQPIRPEPQNFSSEPKSFTVNGVTFKMISVEGGTFTMGASDDDPYAYDLEKPSHEVTLSDYYIGETEVTQALWQAVMGSNPSRFKGENLPVENVSWDDCQAFILKLNELTGQTFRLPTEAEWEYAARGGIKSKGYRYAGSNNLDAVAWYDGNSARTTHPVGQKSPNELGLYDMSGNVYEWCQDWYGSYSSSSQTNPSGASSGSYRVHRGGSWNFVAGRCRVLFRFGDPSSSGSFLGLRLAL